MSVLALLRALIWIPNIVLSGPRACIGRKFATTEAVCFLTMLLREWRVEPLLNNGETVEQWKKRVLQAEMIFTLSIRHVPIRFIRRPRV